MRSQTSENSLQSSIVNRKLLVSMQIRYTFTVLTLHCSMIFKYDNIVLNCETRRLIAMVSTPALTQ